MTICVTEADLTKFEHIQSVRLTDGARLVASRVVVDETTPVRWTIVLKDSLENYIDDELPIFSDTEGRVRKQFATSDLLKRAKEAGFEDWQQLPVALGNVWGLAGAFYHDPDHTPYPVD